MSDTCIVCLGDLGENANANANEAPHTASPNLKPYDSGGRLLHSSLQSPHHLDSSEVEMIAHLLPCGHNLHDECLKPWVQRANSCPICRQSFNLVELSVKVGGKRITATFLVL